MHELAVASEQLRAGIGSNYDGDMVWSQAPRPGHASVELVNSITYLPRSLHRDLGP
jgi:hypothetical protein